MILLFTGLDGVVFGGMTPRQVVTFGRQKKKTFLAILMAPAYPLKLIASEDYQDIFGKTKLCFSPLTAKVNSKLGNNIYICSVFIHEPRLYMRVCPSVGRSVGQLVSWLVGLLVGL